MTSWNMTSFSPEVGSLLKKISTAEVASFHVYKRENKPDEDHFIFVDWLKRNDESYFLVLEKRVAILDQSHHAKMMLILNLGNQRKYWVRDPLTAEFFYVVTSE